MKINLPLIGEVKTGKDAQPVVQTVSVPAKEKGVLLGSFIDLFKKNLSDEVSSSSKLLESYSEWVFANVSVLSEEVSKLEPQLFKLVLRQGQAELEEINDHPVLNLLDRFNETTTRSDAFYVTEAHLELDGNAFYLLDGKGADIKALYNLQPDRMKLELGNFTKQNTRQVKWYEYQARAKDKSRIVRYDPDEIIHIKVPNPNNPYRGKSVVEAAAKSIDTDEASTEALINFFRHGMIAQFALSTDSSLTPDQIKALKSDIRKSYTGAKNAFNVPIFSGGLEPKPIQMNNKEAELIEIERWFRDKIMAMFKNTKTSLGVVEDVNRANAEASQLAWKRNVIVPKMARITDSLNEFLVPRYGDNLILGFKDPIPEDRASQIKDVAALVEGGIMTPNEAREELELEPHADGDDLKGTGPMPNFSPNVEAALRHVNYKAVFRKQGWKQKITKEKAIYGASLVEAKKIVDRRKQVATPVEPKKPSVRRVTNFWRRIADIIEELENQFRPRVENLILEVAHEAAANLDNEEIRQSGEIFNREAKILRIQAELEPVLSNAVALAGQQANFLLGITDPYIPKKFKQINVIDQVREQIEMFAVSMLDTDKEELSRIIANGLKEGAGVPAIRKAIEEKFADFSRSQADRITRTEVAWAANRGVLDAYTQSGVVEAKQWLSAPGACDYCAPMDGKIVSLTESYFDKNSEWLGNADKPMKIDYRSIEEPPLHPNCRCTIISVIEGIGPLIEPKTAEDVTRFKKMVHLKSRIAELEAKVDKRTKKYKKLKAKRSEDKEYIKELEELAGLDE